MQQNFKIILAGSITGIAALTVEAIIWLKQNVIAEKWQWQGNILYIDARYSETVIDAIQQEF